MLERVRRSAAQARTRARFYGLPITSDCITLVIDTSGSMNDLASQTTRQDARTRIEVARQELLGLLEELPESTRLNIIFFNSGVHTWRRGILDLDRRQAASAAAFVESRTAGGATNLYGAVERALEDDEVDTIYLLTDGEPTTGRFTEPGEIVMQARRLYRERRVVIHAISIGRTSELLQQLAGDTGGRYVQR